MPVLFLKSLCVVSIVMLVLVLVVQNPKKYRVSTRNLVHLLTTVVVCVTLVVAVLVRMAGY